MHGMSSIGEKIYYLRTKLNLTQYELALKVGYTSRSTINKIELGKVNVPTAKIEALAKALETTPAYLTGWDNAEQVTEGEAALLELFRRIPEDRQELVLQMIRAALGSQ